MKYKLLSSLFKQAYAIAENSKDEETKVGCLIVDKNGQNLASGYNGYTRGADDDNLPKSRPFKNFIHAEKNAIYQAARGRGGLDGAVCITTLSPCFECMRSLAQSGVTTIYFHKEYRDFQSQLRSNELILELTTVGDYTKIRVRTKHKK